MKKPRTLYHFTSHLWWHFIRAEGITRGECPVTRDKVLQHPNLTVDPDPRNQAWAAGTMTSKTAVRIKVRMRHDDPALVRWVDLTKQFGMDRDAFSLLSAGNRARDWWIYKGVVRPDQFEAVDQVGADASPAIRAVLALVEREGIRSFADFRGRYGDRIPCPGGGPDAWCFDRAVTAAVSGN